MRLNKKTAMLSELERAATDLNASSELSFLKERGRGGLRYVEKD